MELRLHETVRLLARFPGDERGISTVEGGPRRTASGVEVWLVRPLGLTHAEWVAEWRLERA